MAELKIVFTGAVGAGKTTAIQAISDIDVVSTDVNASDEVREQKDTTTVALDYGELALEDGTVLRLYGTPGQRRFSYMWEILAEGALGFVVQVNNQRESPLEDVAMYLENFAPYIGDATVAIGVTHVDDDPREMDKYHNFLHQQDLAYPIFPIDARQSSDVKVMIEAMAAMMNG